MNFFPILLLIIFLILESSITTIPLVFVTLLCITVIYKNNYIFLLAFLFGILIDVLSFNTPGMSSIFFIIFLFLVLIYQRKFEIDTYPFITISSFIGSLIFLFLQGYTSLILFQALINTAFGLIIYYLLKRFIKLDKKSSVNI
jgi:rod shape-determining protein MreD